MKWLGLLKHAADALLAPAVDPRRVFASHYQRLQLRRQQVQQALASIGAAQAQLQTRASAVESRLPALRERAEQALRAGAEDAARLALRQRAVAAAGLQTLRHHLAQMADEARRLAALDQQLAAQIEACCAQQEAVAAHYSAAAAQLQASEQLAEAPGEAENLALALRRVEQQARRMKARAAAGELLEDELLEFPAMGSDELEPRLAGLELAQAVDEQLASLRAELGIGVPTQRATE